MVDELLRVAEAATLLGVKPKTLYGWSSKRLVPSRKHGGRLVFSKADLLAWSTTNKVEALDECWEPVAPRHARKQRRRSGRGSLKTEQNTRTPTSQTEEDHGDL